MSALATTGPVQPALGLLDLPDSVILRILALLPVKDGILSCALTCRSLYWAVSMMTALETISALHKNNQLEQQQLEWEHRVMRDIDISRVEISTSDSSGAYYSILDNKEMQTDETWYFPQSRFYGVSFDTASHGKCINHKESLIHFFGCQGYVNHQTNHSQPETDEYFERFYAAQILPSLHKIEINGSSSFPGPMPQIFTNKGDFFFALQMDSPQDDGSGHYMLQVRIYEVNLVQLRMEYKERGSFTISLPENGYAISWYRVLDRLVLVYRYVGSKWNVWWCQDNGSRSSGSTMSSYDSSESINLERLFKDVRFRGLYVRGPGICIQRYFTVQFKDLTLHLEPITSPFDEVRLGEWSRKHSVQVIHE